MFKFAPKTRCSPKPPSCLRNSKASPHNPLLVIFGASGVVLPFYPPALVLQNSAPAVYRMIVLSCCRWLQWAVKRWWNCVQCRCLPEMPARCCCSTADSLHWHGLSTCTCSTFMCHCHLLPMATQTSSLCFLLCLMSLHSVERAIVNKLFRSLLDFKVKNVLLSTMLKLCVFFTVFCFSKHML